MNWCVEQDLLHENPWGKYRQLPGAKNKPRTGTLEDFQKLFPILPPWLQWAAKTAIALCLRPGVSELFRLEWSAFDWKDKSVSVYMPKVNNTKLVFPPGAYLEETWIRYQSDMSTGQQLVCRSRKESSVYSGLYLMAWRTACRKAGVSMPMYALRHIAASEMLSRGVDIAAIAAQLGHKDITTTGKFYTHAIALSQRRAALCLPDYTNLVRKMAYKDNSIIVLRCILCYWEEKISRSANAVKMPAVIRFRMICPRIEALNHSASLPPRNETPPKTISVAS